MKNHVTWICGINYCHYHYYYYYYYYHGIIPNVCHQSDLQKHFCKYCESNLDKEERPDPNLSLTNNRAIITSKQRKSKESK